MVHGNIAGGLPHQRRIRFSALDEIVLVQDDDGPRPAFGSQNQEPFEPSYVESFTERVHQKNHIDVCRQDLLLVPPPCGPARELGSSGEYFHDGHGIFPRPLAQDYPVTNHRQVGGSSGKVEELP